MKRIISVICCMAVLITAVLASGCGGPDVSGSKYLGTWKAATAGYGGIEMDVQDAVGGEFTFVLNEDATVDLDAAGDKASGTWEDNGDGITIKDGDDELTLSESDEGLVLDQSGIQITFEHTDNI